MFLKVYVGSHGDGLGYQIQKSLGQQVDLQNFVTKGI